MKIAIANSVYIVQETGKPVEGRMSVFYHGTNTYAPVYTLEGSSFVAARNPQLLHSGLPDHSLFTDTGLYDIVIERYIGTEGMMSVYSPDTDFERIDEFQCGMDFDPTSMAAGTVGGLDDLRNVDPSVGTVNVMYYATEGDCCPRTYIWDEGCENEEDGGYVISSDVSDNGKWILMWDDEVMPSSVYGVVPGSTEPNISLLLSYPTYVGTFRQVTAPCVRLLPGVYTSDTSWATDKELLFDAGAKFVSVSFTCPRARVLGLNSDYVADFSFEATDAVAHSSWFRTVTAFWFCGAKKLVIDNDNYFSDTYLRGKPTIANAVIEGAKRIPVSYVNGNFITIERCQLNASQIFSPASDYVKFMGMGWHDEIWNDTAASHYDFGLISGGHHIEFTTSAVNSQELAQFRNTAIYVRMREAQIAINPSASKTLDLQGRSISTFSSSSFTELVNAHVTGNIDLSSAPSGFSMTNVVCDGNINGGTNLSLFNVTGSLGTEWTGSLAAYDCQLSGSAVTGIHDITVVGGRWRKSIINATDNLTNTGTVIFRDCVLDGMNTKITTKNLNLIRCGVYEQKIEIYPYWDSVNSRWLFNGRIEHSEINGTNPVAYKIFHSLGDNCKDCVFIYSWIGNSWFGNSLGMTCEFWADSQLLLNVVNVTGHYVVYSGNSGFCPLEAWHGQATSVTWSTVAFYPEGGDIDSPHTGWSKANIDIRAFPNLNKTNVTNNNTYGSWIGPAYKMEGEGQQTFGYLAATNPMPSYLGYGDLFDSGIFHLGAASATSVAYV